MRFNFDWPLIELNSSKKIQITCIIFSCHFYDCKILYHCNLTNALNPKALFN
jgi:hypothetical protein